LRQVGVKETRYSSPDDDVTKETGMLDRRVEIIKTLRATPVVLHALVEGVDDGRLRRRPGAGGVGHH
jgi:hypothetical protein